ncbi:prepilin-type N-terminal cleavage/methylation domain-containing protein, partial [Paenisporosarcina sp.]|uniref:prepilin-type N-terminal cleavage/methylation domain-containing protein n=1 Tax=Paenisporosarcina sp. TaxID=1932001 RepID=UPI003C706243
MRKFIQQKLKEQKGLTLIELLAVIVILAIIAAIALPAIGNIIQNSRIDAAKSDALNVLSAATLYESQEGKIPQTGLDIATLKTQGFVDDLGVLASGKVYPGPSIYAVTEVLVAGSSITMGADTLTGSLTKAEFSA